MLNASQTLAVQAAWVPSSSCNCQLRLAAMQAAQPHKTGWCMARFVHCQGSASAPMAAQSLWQCLRVCLFPVGLVTARHHAGPHPRGSCRRVPAALRALRTQGHSCRAAVQLSSSATQPSLTWSAWRGVSASLCCQRVLPASRATFPRQPPGVPAAAQRRGRPVAAVAAGLRRSTARRSSPQAVRQATCSLQAGVLCTSCGEQPLREGDQRTH